MNIVFSNGLSSLPRYPVTHHFYDGPCPGGFNRSDFLNDKAFKDASPEVKILYNETIDKPGKQSEAKVKYSLGFCDLLKAKASLVQLKLWTDGFLWLEEHQTHQNEYTKRFVEVIASGANDSETEIYYNLLFNYYIPLYSYKTQLKDLDDDFKDLTDDFTKIVKREDTSQESKAELLNEIKSELIKISNEESSTFCAKAMGAAIGAITWAAGLIGALESL